MYSFGRLNPYNPFWGGFVHESIDKGTFKRFYLTRLPEIVKPEDFKKINGLQEIYRGLLRKYQVFKKKSNKEKIK